jgi:hypothetical protein
MGMMVEILAFQAWALSNLGERTDALITRDT